MKIGAVLKRVQKGSKWGLDFYLENGLPMLKVTHLASKRELTCRLYITNPLEYDLFKKGQYHDLEHDIELIDFKGQFVFQKLIFDWSHWSAYLAGDMPYFDLRTSRSNNAPAALREFLLILDEDIPHQDYPTFFKELIIKGDYRIFVLANHDIRSNEELFLVENKNEVKFMKHEELIEMGILEKK